MDQPRGTLDREWDWVWSRRITLVLAIVLGLLAVVIYWVPGTSPAAAQWISGTSAKLAIVLVAFWMTFPQLVVMCKWPGGSVILVGILGFALLFVVRPQYARTFLPGFVVMVVGLVALRWASKVFDWFPKRKR